MCNIKMNKFYDISQIPQKLFILITKIHILHLEKMYIITIPTLILLIADVNLDNICNFSSGTTLANQRVYRYSSN